MEKVCVYSASQLGESYKKRIENSFNRKHKGEEVLFEYAVDSSLLGGLLIIDGNDYYDSTIAGKLAKVKRNLQ